jgi:replicative DNA helicase
MSPRLDRALPHDLAVEREVIGSVLLDHDCACELLGFLRPAEFYDPRHVRIWEGLQQLHHAGGAVDVIGLGSVLRVSGHDQEQYLLELTDTIPTVPNARRHAERRVELSCQRAMVQACMLSAAEGLDAVESVPEYLASASARIGAVLDERPGVAQGFTLAQSCDDTMADLVRQAERGKKLLGHSTGLSDLDDATAGLEGGALYVVAGRPGMGKTAFAQHIAAAVAAKAPVLGMSYEMPHRQWARRWLSSRARVSGNAMRSLKLSKDDMGALRKAQLELSRLPIEVVDRRGSLLDVRQHARRILRERGELGLIVIDYLQLMRPTQRSASREREVSEMSADAKGLALELDVPVLMLSQLNRDCEKRTDKRPVESDLRECLPVDEWVYTPSGPVQLGSKPAEVISACEDGVEVKAARYVPKRYNAVFEVQTQFGVFRATAKHRVLTGTGWKQVRDLVPRRDVIAAPKRIPHANRGGLPHARLLGWLLGNGGMTGTPSLIYRKELDEDVRNAVARFGVEVRPRRNQKSPNVVDAYLSNGTESGCLPNPLMEWIRDLGLEGKTAHTKSVPAEYLGSSDEVHLDLLRGLWESDGTVTRGVAKYTTVSEELARQVGWLLLTLGVRSTVRSHESLWTVSACAADSERMHPIVDNHERFGALSAPDPRYVDPCPQVFVELADELTNERRFQKRADGSHKLVCKREMAAVVAECPALASVAVSPYMRATGLGWGRLMGVRKLDGEVRVADLQVPGPNNFVAAGVVVHNSGAIEQDADVIMGLYREEKYTAEPNEQDRGVCEVLLLKQRNGPTGTIKVRFDKECTRFDNLWRQSYA